MSVKILFLFVSFAVICGHLSSASYFAPKPSHDDINACWSTDCSSQCSHFSVAVIKSNKADPGVQCKMCSARKCLSISALAAAASSKSFADEDYICFLAATQKCASDCGVTNGCSSCLSGCLWS